METETQTEGSVSAMGIKNEDKASSSKSPRGKGLSGPLFTLKTWNAVAMWQWDVECDTCAICRVQVMGVCILYTDSVCWDMEYGTSAACRVCIQWNL